MTHAAQLTVKETARLAEVPARTVEKAIETKVLNVVKGKASRPGSSQRFLPVLAVAFLAVQREAELVDWPLKHKKALWKKLKAFNNAAGTGKLQLGPVELVDGVTIDVAKLASEELESAMKYIDGKSKHIVSAKDILGGTPVIKGTRMPVHSVLARLDAGESLEEIHEDNPDISIDALQTAAFYAKTNPVQGRPKMRSWHTT